MPAGARLPIKRACIYTIVFTRLGTAALASSQIVMTIENLFIVAAAGLPPAAVASIGQAIDRGSLGHAKQQAGLVLRLGVIVGLGFGAALVVASFSEGLRRALAVPGSRQLMARSAVARLGARSVFGARALEEVLKMFIFLLRYRTPSWYRKSMKRPAAA
jgi:Na+-driven multidrug efflux pump